MITVCQYHVGEISVRRQACIDQLKANLPLDWGYEMIREPLKLVEHQCAMKPEETIRRDSTLARLQLLAEDPHRLWIDTDIMINSVPEIYEGKTYIYGGSCPACVMCGIERIEELIRDFAESHLLCIHHWLYQRNHVFIPETCFTHLKLAGA